MRETPSPHSASPTAQDGDNAFATALTALDVASEGRSVVRGVRGRTISGRVRTSAGVEAWLRVLVAMPGAVPTLLWDGNASATAADVAVDTKPRVLRTVDFTHENLVCRAELTTLVDEPTVSPGEILRADPRLSAACWSRLRAALARLADVPTDRCPRTQQQIDRVLAATYGPGLDTTVADWATAHGDLRWCNLTARTPYLLDWEFWGRAPLGTDAATLYCTSLLVPDVAENVYACFADQLDTDSGRLAQLGIIAQLLRHPDSGDLTDALHHRARVLGHPVAH